jgi:phage shock protein C
MTQNPYPGNAPYTGQPPYKQLRRPIDDRIIAGVCSGIGRYFNLDPVLIRVAFAAVALVTAGVAALAYPIMWFIIPEEPTTAPAWPANGPGHGAGPGPGAPAA